MKRFLPFTIACLIGVQANAQIQLERSEMLPLGSTFSVLEVDDITVIDTTLQGEDVVWDFTALEPYSEEFYTAVIKAPAEVEGIVSPDVNYVLWWDDDYYFGYQLSDTTSKLAETAMSIYNPALAELAFPMAQGTTRTTRTEGDDFYFDYVFKVVGTGSLKLPSGEFPALLVRYTYSYSDGYAYSYYRWLHADNGSILIDYYPADPENEEDEGYAEYLFDITLGANKKELAESKLLINNPVVDFLNVSFTVSNASETTYQLATISGQILKTGTVDSNSFSVDMSEYATGIYLLTVQTAGQAPVAVRVLKTAN